MIDLHLHLDGSLRPATVRELLAKDNIYFFKDDKEAKSALSVSDDCNNLSEYLKAFDYPVQVLQTADNIIRAVRELGEDLHEQSVEYAEIRFAPLLSTNRGLTENEVVEAAIQGAKEAEKLCNGLKLGLILCCMRGTDHVHNMRTVKAAHKYLNNYVCGLDLAGDEAGYPTELYEEEFELASQYDIPFTIHAGEASGPDSIWKALEFGASRIGHGIRCIEDNTLVDYLARYEIPLEVCPISNSQTKVFKDVSEYPIKELLLNGVHVTLNTDNMTVSNTNLSRERRFLMKNCGITKNDLELMEEYSKKAAFIKNV